MPIKAAVMVGPHRPIEMWSLDDPVIERGAVLLETIASEVCGTDDGEVYCFGAKENE